MLVVFAVVDMALMDRVCFIGFSRSVSRLCGAGCVRERDDESAQALKVWPRRRKWKPGQIPVVLLFLLHGFQIQSHKNVLKRMEKTHRKTFYCADEWCWSTHEPDGRNFSKGTREKVSIYLSQ